MYRINWTDQYGKKSFGISKYSSYHKALEQVKKFKNHFPHNSYEIVSKADNFAVIGY